MPRLLVVDDEQAICWGLEQLGKNMGHDVAIAASAEQGLRLAEANHPDVVVLDVRLPGMDGLAAMARFREIVGEVPIIVITAFGDLATAVRAVQNGAFEYVLKPFDLNAIRNAIRRALLGTRTATRVATEGVTAAGLLGDSPAMHGVFRQIALAAASDAPILIRGESGVGKELAARAIHDHSVRCGKPFVAVSPAALNPEQAEAGLFGTSADQTGVLNAVRGGTLLLDEVAEMPLAMQAQLLRVLDQQETPRAGGDDSPANLRVISTTRQNLLALVQAGQFRADLYYRLAAFEILIPPLRRRRSDIELLAQCFVAERHQTTSRLAAETLTELKQREWFGNVRELRQALDHALVVARTGLILPEHLPPPLPPLQADVPTSETGHITLSDLARVRAADLLNDPEMEGLVYERFLEEVEPALLEIAMHRNANECAPAARALGLHRTTLRRKLTQYGLL
jgi:two-component system nitrogen regulation response regulator GlnG